MVPQLLVGVQIKVANTAGTVYRFLRKGSFPQILKPERGTAMAKKSNGYLSDALAPPLDNKARAVLRSLARRELSERAAQTCFRLIASFPIWRKAYGRILREHYRKHAKGRKKT